MPGPSNSERLNVLTVVTAMETGGLEVYLLNVLRVIDRSRFAVSIVCTGRDSNWYETELSELGVQTYYCPNPYSQLGYLRRIRALMRRLNTQVVCDFRGDFAAPTLFAAARMGIRSRLAMYRSTSFGYNATFLRRQYVNLLRRGVRRWATRIAANSQRGLDLRFPEWAKDPRFSVAYNGVDLERFSPGGDGPDVRAELGIPSDRIVIGHVGRFHRAKNHTMLLDAFARVLAHCPTTHLVLVGDGDLRPDIETQIERLGIREHVTLAGIRKDIHRILRAVDVFCFPSRYEGQPNALIEAAAAARPFVASNIQEIAEIMPEPMMRYLVPVDAADECAARLLEFCESTELRARVGAAARELVERRFSISAAADTLCGLWTGDLTRSTSEREP